MAVQERLNKKSSFASSTLLQGLAAVLPKDISFRIYHLSTPPTRATALYPAPPGTRPDRTFCESHFLSASIEAPGKIDASTSEVLVFAIEVLIYSTAHSTTFFVSKADSTGYLHLLNLPKGTPSPLREISVTFLKYLVEHRQRTNIRSVISLFARAQDQYLFPGSIEYDGKHVLDDRGLVKWWCRVLNPLIEDTKTNEQSEGSQWKTVAGYLIVPGLDTHETKSYIPKGTKATWIMGHPLQKISRHPIDVPPRCLIPHFPDDPKARYLDELDEEISKGYDSGSGQWKSIKSIDQFWDMMAFRQECSAGRLVGFIWIVFEPSVPTGAADIDLGGSQSTVTTAGSQPWDLDSSYPALPKDTEYPITPSASFNASSQIPIHSSPLKEHEFSRISTSQKSAHSYKPRTAAKKKKLSGIIVSRQPQVKTENKNYLLARPQSSQYYEWREEGRGQVIVDETDYKRVTELLLRLDFANLKLASSSSKRWINEVRSGTSSTMGEAWGQVVTGTKVREAPSQAGTAGVNNLTMGLVRKKRKAGEEVAGPTALDAVNKGKPLDVPGVNVLSAGMVRKKPKV